MNRQLTITNQNGRLLVDSRQVSVMIEKDHSELLKSIRQYCQYLNAGEIPLVEFFINSTYQDTKGETRICYLLTRKGCDMVANKMTGEKGVLFTAAYVTQFEQMEKQLQPTFAIPQSFAEALLLAAQQQQQIEQQTELLEKARPAVKFMERYVEAPDSMTLREVAKVLRIPERTFSRLLRESSVIYKQGDKWLPSATHQRSGYFEVKTNEKYGVVFTQAYFTPKGVLWITQYADKKGWRNVK